MTAPRRVVQGATYLVSRRCSQREFLLKPNALTALIVKFVLAVAAARYGILVHAICVMSNHWHIVLTDPRANLPEFSRVLGARSQTSAARTMVRGADHRDGVIP